MARSYWPPSCDFVWTLNSLRERGHIYPFHLQVLFGWAWTGEDQHVSFLLLLRDVCGSPDRLPIWCSPAAGITKWQKQRYQKWLIWVWVNTYRYIFSGMNIHLPAILGFTRYQGFDPSPYVIDMWSACWLPRCSQMPRASRMWGSLSWAELGSRGFRILGV